MRRSTGTTVHRRWRRPLVAVVVAGLLVLAGASASAQEVDEVGYDPSKVLVFLASVTAGPDGVAVADLVLPTQTTPGYEIPAEGVGPTDEFRGVLAIVTDDTDDGTEGAMSAELETASGTLEIRLASATLPTQEVDRTITATATGFKPMSTVDFFVRYARAGGAAGEDAGDGAGGLARTGSDVGLLVGIGGAMVVLGAGALWGRRQRTAALTA